MKADFGRSKKSDDLHGIKSGDFETMMKMRKKQLPDIEKSINDMLKDYDGGLVAVIRISEDENGKADGDSMFLGGVSHISTQIRMGKALSKASDKMLEMILEACKGDPKMMLGVAKEMMEELERNMED